MASAEEVATPGSYVTASVGGIPLAVVRDQDGSLRAFHNICRHRGITLLEGSGSLGRFMTCPYHQWSYALNGDLVRVPQEPEQFAGLDRLRLGLIGAQVAEWQGMVFANPSTGAPSLSAAMAGLDVGLDPFLAGPLHQVAKVRYEAACNWKLLVENHIDVYHLWYLHARSLSAYDHRSFQWESLGDNWWSLEPLKDSSDVPVPEVVHVDVVLDQELPCRRPHTRTLTTCSGGRRGRVERRRARPWRTEKLARPASGWRTPSRATPRLGRPDGGRMAQIEVGKMLGALRAPGRGSPLRA